MKRKMDERGHFFTLYIHMDSTIDIYTKRIKLDFYSFLIHAIGCISTICALIEFVAFPNSNNLATQLLDGPMKCQFKRSSTSRIVRT